MTTQVAERLVEFVDALRLKGINAGPSETIDAAAALEVLGFDDREVLREGLAAALVRRDGQRDVFDMTFDVFFPAGVGTPTAVQDSEDDLDAEQLRALLAMALADDDARALTQLAEVAVDALGAVGQEGSGTQGWSAYQTLDRLRPQTAVAQALAMRGGGAGSGQGQSGQFTDRLERDEVRRGVARFRELVAAEARRRTAEVRGRQTVARHAVAQSKDRVDFLSANAHQLAELRRAVQPLARKLATRLAARRRRRRRGQIDIRRTLRSAMSTGGVPVKPVYAAPRPSRPELVLLCDVSGSVAGFSQFTMLLVKALSDQFSKIRVFAFVNAMDEVTDLIKDGSGDLIGPIQSGARITKWHTSSDYGEAFGDFVEQYLDAVGPRTAVIVLGDARNNNQHPRFEALRRINERSRRTYWLNPEHGSRWGLGDSEALGYADIVPMYECCNVEQLSGFVGRILPV
ncbi:VWA domain-containing protein [Aeromicrobium phragmitis]|uniref:VWA domain-containing protein n=1 Tax=Aeromicrobium phragmitis TaxID=2478914 RepID=A0A3L8PJM5_9ACTN|nr:VWA domain-containing protein [Aeromicrobium phragmitis]RLV55596.1 VWA domain-containing protein [Aeromicrobium phragmitis]